MKKTLCIDIDNTICYTKDSNYYDSQPIMSRIDTINRLFHLGYIIVYWTARGANSGIDWTDFTTKQLDEWGCLRHKLLFDKPHYDYWIDDKSCNSEVFFKLIEL